MNREELQALATETRQINEKNGWGLDFHFDHIPSYLCLIHSEISEAWDALNQIDDEQGEAECVAATQRELGDVVVRCMDMCELMYPGTIMSVEVAPDILKFMRTQPVAVILCQMHSTVTQMLQDYRKMPKAQAAGAVFGGLTALIGLTCAYMDTLHAKPHQQVLREILDKNRTRGYRHGGRRT